jgi:CheY-like chemotaxis protein
LETPLNQRPKILLVDDREDNILAYKVALRDVNCELVAANSGAEALTFVIDDEFATGFHDHAIFKKAYASGAIDFLTKPLDSEVLCSKVNTSGRRVCEPPSASLGKARTSRIRF